MGDWIRGKKLLTHYSTNLEGPVLTILTKSAGILKMWFPVLFLCDYSIAFKLFSNFELFSIFSMQRRIQQDFDTACGIDAQTLAPESLFELKMTGKCLSVFAWH